MAKFIIKKYDGNDPYSWAIFRAKDVAKLGKQIFYGQAQPLVSSCSKEEAKHHKRGLEKNNGGINNVY